MINNSKLFAGVAMLMLNFGSRHVQSSLGKLHESILSNIYFQKIIILCMFFVATRDITTAFLLTFIYIIIVDFILNEKNKLCLVPDCYRPDNKITVEQYNKCKQVIKDYEVQQETDKTDKTDN